MAFTDRDLYEYDENETLADDDIFCGTCGALVTDGGGLYCSAECEEIANPSGGF